MSKGGHPKLDSTFGTFGLSAFGMLELWISCFEFFLPGALLLDRDRAVKYFFRAASHINPVIIAPLDQEIAAL